MQKEIRNQVVFLVVLVIVISLSAVMADQIESGFGKVEVSIVDALGELTAQ